MSRPRKASPAELLRGAVAAGSVLIVLALAVFAASPAAHSRLHVDGDPASRDDGCAVVLFATSAAAPLAAIEVAAPLERRAVPAASAAAEILLVAPRYLWQPERGPPAGRVS